MPAIQLFETIIKLNDLQDDDGAEEKEPVFDFEDSDSEIPVAGNEEIEQYALRLLRMLEERVEEFDPLISSLSRNWLPARMPVVDRLILKMGITELLFMPDIPRKVTINEMVELGKLYSTEKSGQFINALLDNVPRELDREIPQEGFSG